MKILDREIVKKGYCLAGEKQIALTYRKNKKTFEETDDPQSEDLIDSESELKNLIKKDEYSYYLQERPILEVYGIVGESDSNYHVVNIYDSEENKRAQLTKWIENL